MKEVLCSSVGTGLCGGNVLVYSRSQGHAGSAFWPVASPSQCFESRAFGTLLGDGRAGMCHGRGVLLSGRDEA